MKKTLIALAAAATVSLGAMGAASAASTTALDVTAQNGASIQKVGYHYYHGYRYNYFHYCKRLYYKGFVLGYGWARYKYYRHCARRYY
jgi:hypothetical protein